MLGPIDLESLTVAIFETRSLPENTSLAMQTFCHRNSGTTKPWGDCNFGVMDSWSPANLQSASLGIWVSWNMTGDIQNMVQWEEEVQHEKYTKHAPNIYTTIQLKESTTNWFDIYANVLIAETITKYDAMFHFGVKLDLFGFSLYWRFDLSKNIHLKQ